MLKSAAYDAKTHILTLTFNTDSEKPEPITVDLGTLVDTYTAGDGLYFSDAGNHNFAIKIATGSEKFLTVDANGLKISGIRANSFHYIYKFNIGIDSFQLLIFIFLES